MSKLDYVAPFVGDDFTLRAAGVLRPGQLVRLAASGQVVATSAVDQAWVGVSTTHARVGDFIGVTSGGVQEPIASGPITAGDAVTSGVDGRVTRAAAPDSRAFVGVALTDASDSAPVRVRFAR